MSCAFWRSLAFSMNLLCFVLCVNSKNNSFAATFPTKFPALSDMGVCMPCKFLSTGLCSPRLELKVQADPTTPTLLRPKRQWELLLWLLLVFQIVVAFL